MRGGIRAKFKKTRSRYGVFSVIVNPYLGIRLMDDDEWGKRENSTRDVEDGR